jgi:DNA modification methylase
MSEAVSTYNPVIYTEKESVRIPFFIKEDIELFNSDCLSIMSGLSENSIEMVFADPHYLCIIKV